MNKALFLDRDGVINEEKNYVCKIEDFVFTDGIFDVLRYFQEQGYMLIIITNQAGIGRGYYTEDDFHTLNDLMLKSFTEQGVYITKVYYCPYHSEYGIEEYKQDSFFRKPNPGMILQAQKEFNIDLSQSVLVGDKESDIKAGVNAGIKNNVLLTGSKGSKISIGANYVISDVNELKSIFDEK